MGRGRSWNLRYSQNCLLSRRSSCPSLVCTCATRRCRSLICLTSASRNNTSGTPVVEKFRVWTRDPEYVSLSYPHGLRPRLRGRAELFAVGQTLSSLPGSFGNFESRIVVTITKLQSSQVTVLTNFHSHPHSSPSFLSSHDELPFSPSLLSFLPLLPRAPREVNTGELHYGLFSLVPS